MGTERAKDVKDFSHQTKFTEYPVIGGTHHFMLQPGEQRLILLVQMITLSPELLDKQDVTVLHFHHFV